LTDFKSLDAFKEYLNELDPDVLIAELQLSTDRLMIELEDYICDYYVREYAEEAEETEEDYPEQAG
jgi:hypothetical protein